MARWNHSPAQMTKKLWGKLVDDRGHLSQELFEQLFAQGLQLMAADRPLPITPIRKKHAESTRLSRRQAAHA